MNDARALKRPGFKKWLVHRRLRPEEFGGRAHQTVVGCGQTLDLIIGGFAELRGS